MLSAVLFYSAFLLDYVFSLSLLVFMNAIKATTRKVTYLKDYKPSDFAVKSVYLDFSLFNNQTIVSAKIEFQKTNKRVKNLHLSGEDLTLLNIAIDGEVTDNYELIEGGLIVKQVPADFTLSTQVLIHPETNTLLEGLYRSSNIFCTQCEAEGFRRITYFLDRPDVMTVYTVRLEADKSSYPVLLSNGNLIEAGDCEHNRHYAIWHDPFPKPSYLFALVAGQLLVKEKYVKTSSKREVMLQVFTEPAFYHQADYALEALHRAMVWDEKTFKLEYDLDRYMIVAIGDFNMGAMENKGLNIFNAKYVLATPETATDQDFLNIENIIGHEYFHNWSGNRVTCRDWFQLSLKEGLTVFRDALFSADMTTKGIKRLEEVRTMRDHQFVEDAGPMSHPVRPDNYIEINNFYTLTVYEKGAEIIRMMYNLVGETQFKRALALYFQRHDGQAVTIEDFAKAMTDATGYNFLGQFFNWYTQAGTPTVHVRSEYDAAGRVFKIHLRQSYPENVNLPANQVTEKAPVVIPIAYRLFDKAGNSLSGENVVVLSEKERTVVFGSLNKEPVVSFLRNFSAPVRVDFPQSDGDLLILLRHDDDLFVRFNALESLLNQAIKAAYHDDTARVDYLIEEIAGGLAHLLKSNTPVAEKAELLHLPDVAVFFELFQAIDVPRLARCVNQIYAGIVLRLYPELLAGATTEMQYASDDLSFAAMSERRLKNACLLLLGKGMKAVDDEDARAAFVMLAKSHYDAAENMTDRMAALEALNAFASKAREDALADFYQRFAGDPQALDKWFMLNALFDDESTIHKVAQLAKSPDFSLTNPNRVRALYGVFCQKNVVQFHSSSGAGYELLGDLLLTLDAINPSIAARLATPLTRFRIFAPAQQEKMQRVLMRLLATEQLSKDLYEIVFKSLENV